nr:uncharacterized protein LOC117842366 isoform X3 [Setaria viridis]
MREPGRPEEMINRYVRLLAATANITRGLGTLALLWSTVVLLGGFVSILRLKEFWVLTGLSFLMACRVVDNYQEFQSGIYMEEVKIIRLIARLGWFRSNPIDASFHTKMLGAVLLPKSILLCLSALAVGFSPHVSLGVCVWRLVQRDYGDAGGDAANRAKLAAALDIFYALVLFQTLGFIHFATVEALLDSSVLLVERVMKQQCGDEDRSWSPLVAMYRSETTRKFKKDGELPDNWNLITYGVGLLQSASRDDDHLWGARLLDKLFDTKDIISVRQEILSSRSSIQNLIGMIGRSSTAGNIENRERAARILAHLASDLDVAHFPVNIADGTYELHPTPEEEAVADLHHAEVEPVLEQAEDQFANSECEEVNIADGTYELHPTPEEEAVADLHHAEVEPVLEQAEDQFANSECEGEDDVSEFAASSAWSTQLPPGWTVEWDPSSDGEDRGQ